MNPELFHALEGKGICFEPLSTDDTQAVHDYASDPNVKRFIGWPLMKTMEDTRNYIEELMRREEAGTHLYASVVLKDTREHIGTVMVFGFDHEAKHAEIGYVFNPKYWGNGYCTEAAAMMENFLFDTLNLRKLHARVVNANIGSCRVLEKNGFEVEGRLKDYYFIEDSFYDLKLFGKFKSI